MKNEEFYGFAMDLHSSLIIDAMGDTHGKFHGVTPPYLILFKILTLADHSGYCE